MQTCLLEWHKIKSWFNTAMESQDQYALVTNERKETLK